MNLAKSISCQFGNPSGMMGKLAGFTMAHRRSNLERIDWAIDLLRLKSGDKVLEVGFGPGIALQKMSQAVEGISLFGLDHSELMYQQASSRNREAMAAGSVTLIRGSVTALPSFEVQFDKVLDINTFQFWDSKVDTLVQLKKHIATNGSILLVHQPRKPGANDYDAHEAAAKMSRLLEAAGFSEVTTAIHQMKPVATVAVRGRNG